MTTGALTVVRLGHPVSNAWLLLDTDSGPMLVDSGFSALWPSIVLGLRGRGLAPADLAAVILTHRHGDHAANASRFAAAGVPIYAHPLDADCLTGRRAPPPLRESASLAGALGAVENRFPSHVARVEPLAEGAELGGLRALWMPGHTEGSLFLWHEASGSLFSGDGLLNAVPPTTLETRLCLPPPDFCDDHPRALRSLVRLLELELPVQRLYTGHGPVWHGELGPALRKLLADEVEQASQ